MATANKHYVKIFYTVDGEPFDDYLSIETDGRYLEGWGLELAASECAEDYYHDHDGWECSGWNEGIGFTLWRNDGERLGDFTVSMEAVPSFRADVREPLA